MADFGQLLELAGDDDRADPLEAEPLHDREDLLLGLDVDSARRLVEEHDAGSIVQPLRDDDLLLIAAAPRRDRLVEILDRDGEIPDEWLDGAALPTLRDQSAPRQAVQTREAGVVERGEPEDESLRLPVLGDQREAASLHFRGGEGGCGEAREPWSGLRACVRSLLALRRAFVLPCVCLLEVRSAVVEPHLTAVGSQGAEQTHQKLGPPGAEHPGDAEDLAAMKSEIHVVEDVLQSEPVNLHEGIAARGSRNWRRGVRVTRRRTPRRP